MNPSTQAKLKAFWQATQTTRPKPIPLIYDLICESEAIQEFIASVSPRDWPYCGQLYQDLVIMYLLGFKSKGTFVDAGAADGLVYSNTYLLEKYLGWDGVLIEANTFWHPHLSVNRKGPVVMEALWEKANHTLSFNLCEHKPLLAALKAYENTNFNAPERSRGHTTWVNTTTLMQVCQAHFEPGPVDLLSIDIEGCEYDCLKDFDFQQYPFRVIVVEHAYTPDRQRLFELLTAQGYERVFYDDALHDDFYRLIE